MKTKLIAFLIIGLSCVNGYAADIQLTWEEATLRTDGKPITGTKTYNLYHQVGANEETVTSIEGAITGHLVSDVVSGVHVFRISTVEDELEGGSSTLIVDVDDIAAAKPGAMVNFSFSFNCSGDGCSQEVE